MIHAPPRVSDPQRERLKRELDRGSQLQVITKVEEPTEWVNLMVCVNEKNKNIEQRLCMDPGDLNKNIKREHCQNVKELRVKWQEPDISQNLMQHRDSGKSSWMRKVQNIALSTHRMADTGVSECHLA